MSDEDINAADRLYAELSSLPPNAQDLLFQMNPGRSYAARLEAHHWTTRVLGIGTVCYKTYLIVLSGRYRTGSNGKAVLRIDRLLCGVLRENPPPSPKSYILIREPQFVATPISTTPVLATTLIRSAQRDDPQTIFVDRDDNVFDLDQVRAAAEVEVSLWNLDGSAAGVSSFSWVCTIEAGLSFPIGS